MSTKIKFIINPKAAVDDALKNWTKSKKSIDSFFPKYDFEMTKNKGQATQIAQDALQNEYETIITEKHLWQLSLMVSILEVECILHPTLK